MRQADSELSMQKVKVHRYVSGKRPEYAPASSSEEESEDDDFLERQRASSPAPIDEIEKLPESMVVDDSRLRRLKTRQTEIIEERNDGDEDEEDDDEARRVRRRRHIQEPEILDDGVEEEEYNNKAMGSDEDEDGEELSDTEIEKRRQSLRQKVLTLKEQQNSEILEKEDEHMLSGDASGGDSSEYEEYTDSEEEMTGPRLKPIFIKKKERHTILEKEKEAAKRKQNEIDQKKKLEDRRRQTLKLVEEEIKKEQMANKPTDEGCINDVNTDDENDEVEYEAWKVREMKRIKRDREEREQIERERMEVDRLRNMTEEERKQELRLNPKLITNKGIKGKYKFMQKYYHRGAFFLDEESQLLKRNFASPTLDDHFEKTILPKVMQVKNFGRSGRTKYTHLVDQDTTQFDSPWVSDTAQNLKFFNNQAAGVKQVFMKPSLKKKKH